MIMSMITVAFLTVVLLSAGVSADLHPAKVLANVPKMTIITKNQSWPVKRQVKVTVEPCRVSRCIDA